MPAAGAPSPNHKAHEAHKDEHGAFVPFVSFVVDLLPHRPGHAGGSGIFVPGPADEAVIGALADGVKAPLNIMLRPTTPPAERLKALGVRRLSSATAPFRAAYGALVEALPGYLDTGTFGSFAGRGNLADLNAVFGD